MLSLPIPVLVIGFLAVCFVAVFLIVRFVVRLDPWIKKALLCLVMGLTFLGAGLFAPREHYSETSTYLVTTDGKPSMTKSGAQLNKDEDKGAIGAMVIGGLFLLGGIVVGVRRK